MKIKFWGARGSIPVSGTEYQKYGGSTTCVEVTSSGGESLIVDSGSGIRKLGIEVVKSGRKKINLIFTHSHWDHILGFPFFKPIYIKGVELNLFGCPFAQASVKNMVSGVMAPPRFPVRFEDISADMKFFGACEKEFYIGDLKIAPIVLSHPNMGIGYRFSDEKSSFVFLTDNELEFRHHGGFSFDDYAKFSAGADLLVHDSEYIDEEYGRVRGWGHSTYQQSFRLAAAAGVKSLGLFHHNQERADEGVDKMAAGCRALAGQAGAKLDCFAVYEGQEIIL